MTIITWIGAIFIAYMLIMGFIFAAGGAAQTGEPSLIIISIVSVLLLIYLLWWLISSTFFSNEIKAPDLNKTKVEIPKAY